METSLLKIWREHCGCKRYVLKAYTAGAVHASMRRISCDTPFLARHLLLAPFRLMCPSHIGRSDPLVECGFNAAQDGCVVTNAGDGRNGIYGPRLGDDCFSASLHHLDRHSYNESN